MALPKRQYIAAVRRGNKTTYKYGEKLKEALELLGLKEGEKFVYRCYEGGNSAECEWLGGGKFRERRK